MCFGIFNTYLFENETEWKLTSTPSLQRGSRHLLLTLNPFILSQPFSWKLFKNVGVHIGSRPLCNTVRLTPTAVLFCTGSGRRHAFTGVTPLGKNLWCWRHWKTYGIRQVWTGLYVTDKFVCLSSSSISDKIKNTFGKHIMSRNEYWLWN